MKQSIPSTLSTTEDLTRHFMDQAVPAGYVWCGNVPAALLLEISGPHFHDFIDRRCPHFGRSPFFGPPKGQDQLTERDITRFVQIMGEGGVSNTLDPRDFAPTEHLVNAHRVGVYQHQQELVL